MTIRLIWREKPGQLYQTDQEKPTSVVLGLVVRQSWILTTEPTMFCINDFI